MNHFQLLLAGCAITFAREHGVSSADFTKVTASSADPGPPSLPRPIQPPPALLILFQKLPKLASAILNESRLDFSSEAL
jgi:hypothetical protein